MEDAPMTKEKSAEVYRFGHLHMILFHSGKPGAAWGVYANYDEKCLTRNPPIFSGVIEESTGKELRKIADAIDNIMREKITGSYSDG